MPEGDTIRRTAAGLRHLEGRVVVEARPASMAGLKGRRLLTVEPHGKHLLMHFEGGYTLHSHMRMTGSWHVYPRGAGWRKPERYARAVLAFEDEDAVLFSAPVVELRRDGQASVEHLGPDILATEFDVAAVVARARAAEAPTIGELLLDQRVASGIGNIYKCESLWLRRLDPWRAPATLSDEELRTLYLTARDLMQQALTSGWRQLRAVHRRHRRTCPRCGAAVMARRQGAQARVTYYCPRCQSVPAAGRPVATGRIANAGF
jgi:endonuclease-8